MPLLVNCPNECQFRVPASRAGRVVRCPKCKSAVRIADLNQAVVDHGQVIELPAKLAKKKSDSSPERSSEKQAGVADVPIKPPSTTAESPNLASFEPGTHAVKADDAPTTSAPTTPHLPIDEEELKHFDPAIQRVLQSPPRVPPVMHSRPWRRVEPLTEINSVGDVPPLELGVPERKIETSVDQPVAKNNLADNDEQWSKRSQSAALEIPGLAALVPQDPLDEYQRPSEIPESMSAVIDESHRESIASMEAQEDSSSTSAQLEDAISVSDAISSSELAAIPTKPIVTKPPVIKLDITPPETESEVDKKSWEQRLNDANADRRMLARFLAGCLFLIAIVNIVPAVSHWYGWATIAENTPLPRWIYLQIFVGAIYTVYSIFLLQISDWSALRSVSVAMLVFAFSFGVISTGLLVGETFAGVLGIPYSLNRRAAIWCVAMLILATLMSYWAGKESSNWRRAEKLLREIIEKTG